MQSWFYGQESLLFTYLSERVLHYGLQVRIRNLWEKVSNSSFNLVIGLVPAVDC